MVIISILVYIIGIIIVLAVSVRLWRDIKSIFNLGCFFEQLTVLLYMLLIFFTVLIVNEQFYSDGLPTRIAVWESSYLWYVLLTLLIFIVFLKYLLYAIIKLNLFGEPVSKITILPIKWDFKGTFLFISEMLSIFVAIWQIISLVLNSQ